MRRPRTAACENDPPGRISMLTPSDEVLSIPPTLCAIANDGGERGHKSSRYRRERPARCRKVFDTSQLSSGRRSQRLGGKSAWHYCPPLRAGRDRVANV